MEKKIVIVGMNHLSAPIEIRERLVFEGAVLAESLRQLISLPSVDEGVILSTCNRVEVLASVLDEDSAFRDIKTFLTSQASGVDSGGLESHLYTYSNESAVRHLFRVAASLDSMVVGEPQILGQLKEYYFFAGNVGTVGSILHRLFHRSFSVAKKVREETGIASRPVSVSSVAVDLAKRIFDCLEEKTVMVIGAGRVGNLLARHLIENGVKSLMITNRTFERAIEFADEFHASPIRFEDFHRYLKLADVVISTLESPEYVLRSGRLLEVLKERKQRAMFLIDLGVPRNFDPQINEIDNAYLYHIGDLEEVARVNLKGREGEANKAEVLVDGEVRGFIHWLSSLGQIPTIVALRARFEEIRRKEIDKSLSSNLKGLSEKEREALGHLTTAMINKILHEPVQQIKNQPMDEAQYVNTLKKLFGLKEV